jgi:hypothetical protein
MKELLTEVGINAGLITSGLFGSLLNIKKDASRRLSTVLLSIGTGVGSANYLTPIVVDIINIDNRNFEFGVAFILGYLGLTGIEFAIMKVLPQAAQKEEPKPTRRRTTTKKKPANKSPSVRKTTTRRKSQE